MTKDPRTKSFLQMFVSWFRSSGFEEKASLIGLHLIFNQFNGYCLPLVERNTLCPGRARKRTYNWSFSTYNAKDSSWKLISFICKKPTQFGWEDLFKYLFLRSVPSCRNRKNEVTIDSRVATQIFSLNVQARYRSTRIGKT